LFALTLSIKVFVLKLFVRNGDSQNRHQEMLLKSAVSGGQKYSGNGQRGVGVPQGLRARQELTLGSIFKNRFARNLRIKLNLVKFNLAITYGLI
jgi:hypothetical protein